VLKTYFSCLAFLTASLVTASTARAAIDTESLDRWATAYFNERLEQTHVPGAVLVVVQGGKPVFSKGFGTTTPEGGQPVDPNTTLFRVGSITKVLTAIAVSQLVEEGVLDMDEDVNSYLQGVSVPDTFAQPITVRHLLSHTGGFGSELRGADVPFDEQATLDRQVIQRLLAPRLREPGSYPAYDNNGWGLLGLVAADAAETDYRSLIEERIFTPLNMRSAEVGLPQDRRSQAAVPHNIMLDGEIRRIDYSILTNLEEGAGNATLTGADAARLMIALLNRGQLDGQSVLSGEAFAEMTEFDFWRIHPDMPGFGRALYEYRPAGRKAVRHDGGISGFVSSMVLYPQANVGVFWSFNAQPYNPFQGDSLSELVQAIRLYMTAGDAVEALVPEFMKFYDFHTLFAEQFIPNETPSSQRSETGKLSADSLQQLEGLYRSTRAEYGTFIGNLQARLLGGQAVSVIGEDRLKIGAEEYLQQDNGTFLKVDNDELMAFQINKHGVFMGDSSLFISRKISNFETPLLTILPLLLLPVLLLSGLFYLKSRHPRDVQLARHAGLAAIAFLLALGLEAEYANEFLVEGRLLPMMAWRLVLLIALLDLIHVAFRSLQTFVRDLHLRWQGIGAAIISLHKLILGLSAAGLLFLAYYWRLFSLLVH